MSLLRQDLGDLSKQFRRCGFGEKEEVYTVNEPFEDNGEDFDAGGQFELDLVFLNEEYVLGDDLVETGSEDDKEGFGFLRGETGFKNRVEESHALSFC